ncbi:MAG: CDP-alcohol phosphatidyltransferase family protein [Acidothermus sp.]|nr:CDP-alcohol phosphatidyltransferase family protein [Acidothermus sp.]MCL6538532.1 CDP-alcohol phosphatidyltransferase family protein [Acidothermus sp.]
MATHGVRPRRVLTVPNLLSALRLLGVPIFLWLALGPRADGWALTVLALAGVTDWLDGKIARRLGQISRLGELLDPTADRLYILATLVALSVRGIAPWWFTGLLIARDAVLGLFLVPLRRAGVGPLPVHFFGKTATMTLLYALPLLLLGSWNGPVPHAARTVGWAFALWGLALYWYAGFLYGGQAVRLLARTRRGHHDGSVEAATSRKARV